MTSRFFVLEKNDPQIAGQRYQFVRDGWHFWAFAFPLFWLIYHRLWFCAGVVFLAMAGLLMLASQIEFLVTAYLALLALGIYVGLEGGYWRAAAFESSDYRLIDRFEADTLQEAQLRFGLDRINRAAPPPLPHSRDRQAKPHAAGDMIFADIVGRS